MNPLAAGLVGRDGRHHLLHGAADLALAGSWVEDIVLADLPALVAIGIEDPRRHAEEIRVAPDGAFASGGWTLKNKRRAGIGADAKRRREGGEGGPSGAGRLLPDTATDVCTTLPL